MAWMHVDGPEPARGVSKDDAIQRGRQLCGYEQVYEGLQWLKEQARPLTYDQYAQFDALFESSWPGPTWGPGAPR